MQVQSSSYTHPLIIIRFSAQAHAWIVVEQERGEAVAALICQMGHDSKLRDRQLKYCLLHLTSHTTEGLTTDYLSESVTQSLTV